MRCLSLCMSNPLPSAVLWRASRCTGAKRVLRTWSCGCQCRAGRRTSCRVSRGRARGLGCCCRDNIASYPGLGGAIGISLGSALGSEVTVEEQHACISAHAHANSQACMGECPKHAWPKSQQDAISKLMGGMFLQAQRKGYCCCTSQTHNCPTCHPCTHCTHKPSLCQSKELIQRTSTKCCKGWRGASLAC